MKSFSTHMPINVQKSILVKIHIYTPLLKVC